MSLRSKPPRRGPMPPEVAEAVIERAGGYCEAQTPRHSGRPTVIHHRKLRRQGGPDIEDNLMHICEGCHLYIHAEVAESYDAGWLLHSYDEILPYERTTT